MTMHEYLALCRECNLPYRTVNERPVCPACQQAKRQPHPAAQTPLKRETLQEKRELMRAAYERLGLKPGRVWTRAGKGARS